MKKLLFVLFQVVFWQGIVAQHSLWPLPSSVSTGNSSVVLSQKSFSFKCAGSCSGVITRAFSRYTKFIFFSGTGKSSADADLQVLSVSCSSAPPLDLYVDESYSLTITATSATLSAPTEWGCLHGLEAFSQLVDYDPVGDSYSINVLPVKIQDEPRFPWRGLLIDSSRHFLPVSAILRTLDAMAFNKLNVLHWHIVDTQSFPLQLKSWPLLSQKGAWAPAAQYSQSDVQSIINYATDRGIRVVPEFDTPGHAQCWGNGYPKLFPNCPNSSPVINPTTSYTYNFMKAFFQEVSALFPDTFVHLGGDEVSYDCWKEDTTIADFMTHNGIQDYSSLQGYYEQNLQNIVLSNNKIPAYWDEVFGDGSQFPLNKSAVIHVWNAGRDEVANVVKAGYRAVYSTAYYLDRQIPDSEQYYLWGDTWKAFYAEDPVGNTSLTPAQLELVIGGEASMWGEQVDFTDLDVRIWPRACAVAERMWSPQKVTSIPQAIPRLGDHRCRMVRRGINAFPIYPDYCHLGPQGQIHLPIFE